MSARSLTFALLSTLLVGGFGAANSASAATNHPPGPDRCWARHHQQWVWVCPARERPQVLFFEPSDTGSAFTDPGYPDRNYSDPGYYDPSYYNTIPLFFFDLPSR